MIPGITPREYYLTAVCVALTSSGSRRREAIRIARLWLRLLHARRRLAF
jgi:hypothetical protein